MTKLVVVGGDTIETDDGSTVAIVEGADFTRAQSEAQAARLAHCWNCHDNLVAELENAVNAAEYVVKICEDDVARGESPNPMVRSTPGATLAHCYAAMAFVNKARTALTKAKDISKR